MKEFHNLAIDAFYRQNGISHPEIPPNTSRLNMVERTHRTLTGMMRAIMQESELRLRFG